MDAGNSEDDIRQSERARLNMQHGFIKSIVKNQLDRDQYDKQVKEKEAAQKSFVKKSVSKTYVKKEKKPEIPIYIPPHRKQNSNNSGANDSANLNTSEDTSKEILFRLEFEDENGGLHDIIVHKNEDPRDIASNVDKSAGGLSSSTMNLLIDRLKKEIQARSGSG